MLVTDGMGNDIDQQLNIVIKGFARVLLRSTFELYRFDVDQQRKKFKTYKLKNYKIHIQFWIIHRSEKTNLTSNHSK